MKDNITLILSEGCELPWTAGLELGDMQIAEDKYIPFAVFMYKHIYFNKFSIDIIGYKVNNKTFNQRGKAVIVEDYDSQGVGGLRLVIEIKGDKLTPLINNEN